MMALLNQKKATLIGQEQTYINTLHLCLFTDDRTPADADIDSYYTEPSGGTGYTYQTFSMDSAFLNSDNQGELLASAVTFTFTGSGMDFTVYGYFYRDPADDHIVMAERFGTPQHVTFTGQTINVTPRKVMTTLSA